MSAIRIEGSAVNANINGVRLNHVLLLAGHDAAGCDVQTPTAPTPDEVRIAARLRVLLRKMHTRGYMPSEAQLAAREFIIDEAQRVKPSKGQENGRPQQ